MASKTKVILLMLSIILTILLALYSTLAWFKMIETTEPILINTGSLRVESKFYFGVDQNGNGTIEDNEYDEVTEGSLPLYNVIPGNKFYYRITVENKGTIDGFLSISINDIKADVESMLAGFKIKYIDPTSVIVEDDEELEEMNQQEEQETPSPIKEIFFDKVTPVDGKLRVMLFKNLLLTDRDAEDGNNFTFDFEIEVTPDINGNVSRKKLEITNFTINLVQKELQ